MNILLIMRACPLLCIWEGGPCEFYADNNLINDINSQIGAGAAADAKI
jgi:hypothetical protein